MNYQTLLLVISCAMLGFGLSFKRWWLIVPGILGIVGLVLLIATHTGAAR